MNRINWTNVLFFSLTGLAALTIVPWYFWTHGVSWPLVALSLVYYALSAFSITGGYHRMFAHRSYAASPTMEWFYLLVGASAFQGPVLEWASEHRRHHRFVDTEKDPYNVKQGFYHAHIGWLFRREAPDERCPFATDLAQNPRVMWQYRYYVPLAIFMSFGVPTLIGAMWGEPLGGFLIGGLLRKVVCSHCTFFINSFCHMFGTQQYSGEVSARDNFVLAFFTFGEGYHNYHHHFSYDYRNGVRWYHWDPTKWSIRVLELFGMAKQLKSIPAATILAARVERAKRLLVERGVPQEQTAALIRRVEEAQAKFRKLKEDYRALRTSVQAQSMHQYHHLKRELRASRREAKATLNQWWAYVRSHVGASPAI